MRLALSLILTLWLAGAAAAHEFWISAREYQVSAGDPIEVTTRIGEKFKAPSRPFLPNSFVRFDAIVDQKVLPVTGRIGDDPVFVTPPEGLVVLVHETKDLTLRYTDPAKWPKFVAHKDFAGALQAHAARGLQPAGFQERYRRFAKALVAVGDGQGADRAMGLRTEIVALANPYTDDVQVLPVRVLLEGAPRAGAQVELFDRAPDGTVTITLHRTDADGVASLPLQPGHDYLADAVTLVALDNDDPEAGPVWETLWAAMTFAVPKQ